MSGLDELQQRVDALLQAPVKLEAVDLLMPEKSGKFRLIYPRPGD